METRLSPWAARLFISLIPAFVTVATIASGVDWVAAVVSALGIYVYLSVITASENTVLFQVLEQFKPRDTTNVISLQQIVSLLAWIVLIFLAQTLHPILLILLILGAIAWASWIFSDHRRLYLLQVQRTQDTERKIIEMEEQFQARVAGNPQSVNVDDRAVDLSGSGDQ